MSFFQIIASLLRIAKVIFIMSLLSFFAFCCVVYYMVRDENELSKNVGLVYGNAETEPEEWELKISE